MTATTERDLEVLQRRVRRILITGQVMAGLGMGATLSMGAILASRLSGSEAWSGMAATMSTLGAALAAVPLARLAGRSGRRISLFTGALLAASGAIVTIVSTMVAFFPLLLVGLALIGVGTAVNLQSRFAATDIANDRTRSRDLSLVVWATTVGAVSGPNLITPGEALGSFLGLPELAGPFVFTLAAQTLAAVVYFVGLRPDPLLLARELARDPNGAGAKSLGPSVDNVVVARTAIISIALSHATMVAVMAMTPVHLVHHGASLAIVGFTISLHIAGMYALAPVFGILSDRIGRIPTILVGQVILLASLLFTGFGSENELAVVIGLVLLGLGWSAATVAGSTLLSESTIIEKRAARQGVSDLVMSGAGAAGGALAGVVLAFLGYSGLSFVALALVASVVARITLTRAKASTPASGDVEPITYDI
ncbi:MFS transporter [Pontimonas sp.]|nr:MFS transporter [Pontimonas sp.]MDA8887155.1 MFS transporter [Pontimonas sp.]